MKKLFGPLGRFLVAAIAVLGGLAETGNYLEQSQTPPWVVKMISSYVSLGLLSLMFQLLFLFLVVACLWRLISMEEEIQTLDDVADLSIKGAGVLGRFNDRLRKLEGVKEPYVTLGVGEIIHPSFNGVLWKWEGQKGADGPFCPRHRKRLFHKNWLNQTQIENFDDAFLNETWWLTCPEDGEDFKLSVSTTTRVRDLRAQAAARLRDE